MIQIGPDMAEIQMVQARQAQQQAPAQGIASQWSAAQQGMPASPLASVTAANPMGGGLGGAMVGTGLGAVAPALPAMNRTASASMERNNVVDDDGFNWRGAGQGALQYGMAGASIGTTVAPGMGTAIGGAVGAVGGALVGGYS